MQPSPRLQLTRECGASDGDFVGLLLRKLPGLRAARGERVGLALALALVPPLCTCVHGDRGRRQATEHCRRAAQSVRLHVCQVSLHERLRQLGVRQPMQQILELDPSSLAMYTLS